VGRVQVAVWVREGLEVLGLAAAHRGDGLVYCFAVGLIAFFRNGIRQLGRILPRRRRRACVVRVGVTRVWNPKSVKLATLFPSEKVKSESFSQLGLRTGCKYLLKTAAPVQPATKPPFWGECRQTAAFQGAGKEGLGPLGQGRTSGP
jgi:hypothetical protein